MQTIILLPVSFKILFHMQRPEALNLNTGISENVGAVKTQVSLGSSEEMVSKTLWGIKLVKAT